MCACPDGANLQADAVGGIEVNALAAIGREEQSLLVVRRPHDARWFLPGAAIVSGVPVENALRRALNDEIGVPVTFLKFLAAVEHGHVDRFGIHHKLNLIFDAGLADSTVKHARTALEIRWMSSADLMAVELSPPGFFEGPLSGRFDDGDRWLPWHKDENPY